MVKFPDPEQPDPVPVKFHVPVMPVLPEPLVSVPCMVNWLVPFAFDAPDWIVIWNAPVVTPLVVPLAVNVPTAVVPEAKHEDEVVKLRFETVTAPLLLLPERVAVKASAVAPSVLVSVAAQFPLIGVPDPPPQPASIIAVTHKTGRKKCLMPGPPRLEKADAKSGFLGCNSPLSEKTQVGPHSFVSLCQEK
jgi:hypothetical protein